MENTQNLLENISSSWQAIFSAMPPLVNRKQVAELSGGLVAVGSLANADCEGTGIAGRRIIGKRVCYPRENVIAWLMALEKPAKVKAD